MQVIPYISELLDKVREQQAQAERITGFQAQFGYVYAIIAIEAVPLPYSMKQTTVVLLYAHGTAGCNNNC